MNSHSATLVLPKSMDRPPMAKALASTVLGTILEWYDFCIFAYLAPVMARLFFPNDDKYAAMLMAYGVFAVGFLIRPVGAACFGHYGDRFGRKRMLVISLVVIAIATTLIGVLPTYEQAGMVAPILLVLLRLVQGFCIGGEATGATAFVLETYAQHKRGMLGSLAWSATGVGMLLGSLVATITSQYFDEASLYQWGWRLPFLMGAVAGIVGFYIRKAMPESSLFRQAERANALSLSPLRESLSHHKRDMLKVTGLYALSAMITYLIFVFMPNYVTDVTTIPFKTASLVATIAIAVVTLMVPLSGLLSDRIGRKPCLRFAAMGFVLLSFPLFWLLSSKATLASFIFVESVFVLLAMVYQGVLTATVQELAQTRVRYSVSAIGYNLSYSIFGGTAPLVGTTLVHWTHLAAAPGLYLALGGVAALVVICTLDETACKPM